MPYTHAFIALVILSSSGDVYQEHMTECGEVVLRKCYPTRISELDIPYDDQSQIDELLLALDEINSKEIEYTDMDLTTSKK